MSINLSYRGRKMFILVRQPIPIHARMKFTAKMKIEKPRTFQDDTWYLAWIGVRPNTDISPCILSRSTCNMKQDINSTEKIKKLTITMKHNLDTNLFEKGTFGIPGNEKIIEIGFSVLRCWIFKTAALLVGHFIQHFNLVLT